MTLPEARSVFADLMQKARTATLTDSDRRRLTQARQLLRRAKRPAMNPRRQYAPFGIGDKSNQYWVHAGGYTAAFHTFEAARDYARGHYKSSGTFIKNRDGKIVWKRDIYGQEVDYTGSHSRQKENPSRSGNIQRLGRATEVRYKREVGRKPGFYKHAIESRRAGVYTIPAGWVYVAGKSILISESVPRGRR